LSLPDILPLSVVDFVLWEPVSIGPVSPRFAARCSKIRHDIPGIITVSGLTAPQQWGSIATPARGSFPPRFQSKAITGNFENLKSQLAGLAKLQVEKERAQLWKEGSHGCLP